MPHMTAINDEYITKGVYTMSVKHVGKAQQEREQRDDNNGRFFRLYALIAAVALIVSCAIAMFQP